MGIDPGINTWIAGARRGRDNESNIKISSKQWYYATKQNIRDKKGKKMTENFENAAKADRESYFDQAGFIVSPKGMRIMLVHCQLH